MAMCIGVLQRDDVPMTRLPRLATLLFSMCASAWWDAWDALWEDIRNTRDPEYQRDLRSQDRNLDLADLDQGGTFYAAGCGSDGD